jgi:general secretion pathway protein G
MKGTRRRKRGFTLIELLVVIVIISLIATVVAPRVFRGIGKARADIAKAKMVIIEGSIERFHIDCGRYPDESEGLDELLNAPEDLEEKWRGPYLKKSDLLDPWENPYIYMEEGEVNPGSYDLVCYGADGQPGGEGDNKDIYND